MDAFKENTLPKMLIRQSVRRAQYGMRASDIKNAVDTYTAAAKEVKYESQFTSDAEWLWMLTVTTVYQAGIMQGKREERARRRRTGNTSNA